VQRVTPETADRSRRSIEARPKRLCIATRAVLPVSELIRFVAGPGGMVVADVKHRLPGRGVWLSARRPLVKDAVRRQAFSRGLRDKAWAPTDLAAMVEAELERAALEALSKAHRAGLTKLGRAAIAAALKEEPVMALITAREASAGPAGRHSALRHDEAAPVAIATFSAAQLDLAVGRPNVVDAALLAGRASETFLERWRLLELFRADDCVPPATRNTTEARQCSSARTAND
jgi:uncharacterized protein